MLDDRFGVADDVPERAAAALQDRAERLLPDRRDATLAVARRGIVVEHDAVPRCVVEPPRHRLIDAPRDVRRDGALAQQVLGAEDLRSLAKNDAATGSDEQVGGDAERRVGRDRGRRVAPAALEAERQLAQRDRLALGPLEAGRHRNHSLDERGDRRVRAAELLDAHMCDLRRAPCQEVLGLVHLTPERDDDDTREVRVHGVATERPAQELVARCSLDQRAAEIVREGDHPVAARQAGDLEARRACGEPRHGGGAVDAREDPDVVARRNPSARTAVSEEVVVRGRDRRTPGAGIGGTAVPLRRWAVASHAEVVAVHVLAGRDRRRRLTDPMAELEHPVALGEVDKRDLMPRGDHRPDGKLHLAHVDHVARAEVLDRDADVVGLLVGHEDAGRVECGRAQARAAGGPAVVPRLARLRHRPSDPGGRRVGAGGGECCSQTRSRPPAYSGVALRYERDFRLDTSEKQ